MRAGAIGAGTEPVKEVETIAFGISNTNDVTTSHDVLITLTDANSVVTKVRLEATAAATGDALADLFEAKTVTGYSLTSNGDGTLSIENDTANVAFTVAISQWYTTNDGISAVTATDTSLQSTVTNTTAASAGAANAVAEVEVINFTGQVETDEDVKLTLTDGNGVAVSHIISANNLTTATTAGDLLADLFEDASGDITGYTLTSGGDGTLEITNNTANVTFTAEVALVYSTNNGISAVTAGEATLIGTAYNKTAAAAGANDSAMDGIADGTGINVSTSMGAAAIDVTFVSKVGSGRNSLLTASTTTGYSSGYAINVGFDVAGASVNVAAGGSQAKAQATDNNSATAIEVSYPASDALTVTVGGSSGTIAAGDEDNMFITAVYAMDADTTLSLGYGSGDNTTSGTLDKQTATTVNVSRSLGGGVSVFAEYAAVANDNGAAGSSGSAMSVGTSVSF